MTSRSDFNALNPAERRFVEAVAATRESTPWDQLESFGENDAPAIVDGRLARVRLYSTCPKSLDLRGLDALVSVSTVHRVGLESVVLGEHPQLEVLRVDEGALEELDLRGCPALRKLDVRNNKLSTLGELPLGLVELLCSKNPLRSLDVSKLEVLEVLSAFECGLTTIDLTRLSRLREVLLMRNELTDIDATSLRAVRTFHVEDNGARVALPASDALTALGLSGNAIAELDTSAYPSLVRLDAARCGLRALRMENAALESLDARGNELRELDLRGAPRLSLVKLGENPLRSVDVSTLRRLASAELPEEAEIVAAELQSNVVPELRARFGLGKANRTFAKMGPYELHRIVEEHNWDDGEKKLFDVVRHPQCDKATALLAYWNSMPGDYLQHGDPKDAPKSERKMVTLLREIEKKVESDGFATAMIPFDVHDVAGTDLAVDDRRIPAVMRKAVRPPNGGLVVAPPRKGARTK